MAKLILQNQTEPASPDAGCTTLYVDSCNGKVKTKDSEGNVCELSVVTGEEVSNKDLYFGKGTGCCVFSEDCMLETNYFDVDKFIVCNGVTLRFKYPGTVIIRANEFCNMGTIDMYVPKRFVGEKQNIFGLGEINVAQSKNCTAYFDVSCTGGAGSGNGGAGGGPGEYGTASGGGTAGGAGACCAGGGGGGCAAGGNATPCYGGTGGYGCYIGGAGGGGFGLCGGGNGGMGMSCSICGGNGGNSVYGKGGDGGCAAAYGWGGKGGDSIYGDGGKGGDAYCYPGGAGGNSIWGNGGNGGCSCYSSSASGSGGCSLYGYGGNGGYTLYSSCSYSGGHGGDGRNGGKGGCSYCSKGGRGGNAIGFNNGLGILTGKFYNNCILSCGGNGGRGGEGRTTTQCGFGGNGSNGGSVSIYAKCIINQGGINVTGGTGGSGSPNGQNGANGVLQISTTPKYYSTNSPSICFGLCSLSWGYVNDNACCGKCANVPVPGMLEFCAYMSCSRYTNMYVVNNGCTYCWGYGSSNDCFSFSVPLNPGTVCIYRTPTPSEMNNESCGYYGVGKFYGITF